MMMIKRKSVGQITAEEHGAGPEDRYKSKPTSFDPIFTIHLTVVTLPLLLLLLLLGKPTCGRAHPNDNDTQHMDWIRAHSTIQLLPRATLEGEGARQDRFAN